MARIIKFAYCDEFKCLGSDCPETCCGHWNIFFNQNGYLKCKNADCSEQLKEIIDKSFVKVTSNDNSSFDYAVIKLKEDGYCPLLDEDKLCMLQKELGEEYLGFVCSSFPRLKTAVGSNNYIYSLNISCCKVCSLLINHTEGLQLLEEEYDGGDKYLNSGLYSAPSVPESWYGYPFYWLIKSVQIDILQNRKFTLPERMLILGYFSQKANQYINRSQGEKIYELANFLMYDGNLKKTARSLKPKQSDKDRILKASGIFAKLWESSKSKNNPHINRLFQAAADSFELVITIKKDGKATTELNFEKYLNNLSKYNKLEFDRPYIIENILVNQILTQPLHKGIWKHYFILLLFYNLLKTCVPAFLPENYSDEDLAAAISRTAKMTLSNNLIEKTALLDFVDHRAMDLPHGAYLV